MSRKTWILLKLVLASSTVAFVGVSAADQSGLAINTQIQGRTLTFDWPEIQIGTGSYEEGPTGLTIIRFPNRVSMAVDVRGGAPGTVNTDSLRLGYISRYIDAVVFSGGSSYGEETITATATGLKDSGIRSGRLDDVAFVPGAIIYDFGSRRLNDIYPDKRLAQATLHALRRGVFPLGAQGAGRMAMQGAYFGCNAHSGQGGAFHRIGLTKIAAFVVVNAYGGVTDRDGRLVNCNRAGSWGNLTRTFEILQHMSVSPEPSQDSNDFGATRNTTISLVVTNQKLNFWELQRLAVQVHTSMARAIQPFSTQADGDTLFAVSTQEVDNPRLRPIALSTAASEVMWDAVLSSVPEQQEFVPPATPVRVGADVLESYVGNYQFGPSAKATSAPDPPQLRVFTENSTLRIEAIGQQPIFEFEVGRPIDVLAASQEDFYVDGRYHTRISFIRGSTGRITGALLNPGRWEQYGEKID